MVEFVLLNSVWVYWFACSGGFHGCFELLLCDF